MPNTQGSRAQNDLSDSNSSSDDDFGIPSMKLTRTNWYHWKMMLRSYLIIKGYEGLLDEEWTKTNLPTEKYRQRNAWASSLLLRTVSSELHYVLSFDDDKSFLESYHALGKDCGVSSIVTFSIKQRELHQLRYPSGTPIREYMNKFNTLLHLVKAYMTDLPDFGTISSGMAACIFLNSFSQDESLQPLIGTLLYLDVFNYENVYKSMGFEASRRECIPNSFPPKGKTPMRSDKARHSNNESSHQNSNRTDNTMKSDHGLLVKRVDKLERMMRSHLSTSK